MLFPAATPNACHLALAKLEKEKKLKAVITQNIDGLHQKAGSKTYSSFTAACGAIIAQNAEKRIPWQRSSRRTACLSARAGEW